MKIDMEFKNPILFVRLSGNLNRRNNSKINNYLVSLIKKHHIKYLVCNLSNLIDIDISGMEALINLKCTLKNNKGVFYLCGIHSRIDKYLKPLKIKKADNELLAVELIGERNR